VDDAMDADWPITRFLRDNMSIMQGSHQHNIGGPMESHLVPIVTQLGNHIVYPTFD
jgi:hypothetical protein